VHGHIRVNGEKVDVPSYRLKPGDAVTLAPGAPVEHVVRRATELTAVVPPWLEADHEQLSDTVLRPPERHQIDAPDEKLIVEHYSR